VDTTSTVVCQIAVLLLGSLNKASTHHQTVWQSIGPLVGTLKHGLDNTDSDELSPTPAEVAICCEIATKRHGADFGSVRDGDRHENTPWDSREDLTGQQRLDIVRSEEDGGDADEPD
jgi:hypothetical protein